MFISCLSAGLCNLGLSPSVNNITLDEKKKKYYITIQTESCF